MTNKCESCRYYEPSKYSQRFDYGFCNQPVVAGHAPHNYITTARQICDREGNGTFVYFEPKTPTAGAACYGPTVSPVGSIVDGEPILTTTAQPDDWRKELNKHFRTAGA